MSNRGAVKWTSIGLNSIGIFLAAIMLYLSVQMTKFGVLHFPIDVSELSPAERVRSQRKQFVANCNDWKSEFGYRLICRKAIADNFFANELREIADPKAQQVLDDVIKISAMEPAYYVMRARIGLLEFKPFEEIIRFIRLSYLSGRAEQPLMYQRFQIGIALWDSLDQTDKSFVINDYIKSVSNERSLMHILILSASISVFSEIAEMIKNRDPDAYQQLLQGRSVNSHP